MRLRNAIVSAVLAATCFVASAFAFQNALQPQPCEFLHESFRDYRTNFLESWRENEEFWCHFQWHVYQFIAMICVEPQVASAPCYGDAEDYLYRFNDATGQWEELNHTFYSTFQAGCGAGHPPELIGGAFNVIFDLEPDTDYQYRMIYSTGTLEGARPRMDMTIEVSTKNVDGCPTNP